MVPTPEHIIHSQYQHYWHGHKKIRKQFQNERNKRQRIVWALYRSRVAQYGTFGAIFFNSKIECQNVNEPLKCQPNICSEWNTHGDRATQDVTILCNIRKLRLFAKKWAQSISNTSVTRQPWNEVFNQRAFPSKSIFNDKFHIVLLWNHFSVIWYDYHTSTYYLSFYLTRFVIRRVLVNVRL